MEAVPVFLRVILVPVFGRFGGESFHFLTHGADVCFPMVIYSSSWDCRSFEVWPGVGDNFFAWSTAPR